ncbi:MAG: hypothetical protein JXQ75_06365 [Phycisphaerae bacterium]|nr:hypothetical protein [Phycisphaerae bacterium]
MTKRRYNQYKWVRKLAILMAAAPLFQMSQCATGLRQTAATVADGMGASDTWPVTIVTLLQNLALLFLGGGV